MNFKNSNITLQNGVPIGFLLKEKLDEGKTYQTLHIRSVAQTEVSEWVGLLLFQFTNAKHFDPTKQFTDYI